MDGQCFNIIIKALRNRKIAWRYSGLIFIWGWTWVPKDTCTRATSEYITSKYWEYQKIKRTVLSIWPTSWSTDISSIYCSDINLFLIMPGVNYAINSCSFSRTTLGKLWRKNIVAIITQDRVIDDNLKRQIKNRTLHTCRLFLLTWSFQYISNWSKVLELLPTLYLQYT